MKRMKIPFLVGILVHPVEGWTCAVCGANAESTEAQALTWAVWFLVGVVAVVLAGFARFMWHLRSLEKKVHGQQEHSERKAS